MDKNVPVDHSHGFHNIAYEVALWSWETYSTEVPEVKIQKNDCLKYFAGSGSALSKDQKINISRSVYWEKEKKTITSNLLNKEHKT